MSAKWTCAPSLKPLNTSDKETIAQNWLAHHYSDYATFLCLYVEIIDDNLVGRLTNPAPSKSFRKHKHYTKSNKIIHKHKKSQRIKKHKNQVEITKKNYETINKRHPTSFPRDVFLIPVIDMMIQFKT